MNALDALGPQLRHAIEMLVDERIDAALRLRRPERRWVSVREAKAILGLSEPAIRGRISKGRIPVKRQGRSVLVDLVSLDRELDAS